MILQADTLKSGVMLSASKIDGDVRLPPPQKSSRAVSILYWCLFPTVSPDVLETVQCYANLFTVNDTNLELSNLYYHLFI